MGPKKLLHALPKSWQTKLRQAMRPEGDFRGVIDLRKITNNPIEACYMAHRKSPVIEVSTKAIRTFQCVGLPLDEKYNPFVATANFIKRNKHASYEYSPLCTYHNSFQPKDAFELLHIEPCKRMIERGFSSPFAAVLPWWPDVSGIRPEDRHVSITTNAASDYRALGIKAPENANTFEFGPFSNVLGNFEYMRLQKLINSIGVNGFQRNDTPDGDIKGVVLVNSDLETKILLNGGQHRAAVAAAMGFDNIPVRLFPTISSTLIRRDDVDFWPYVKSGLFSRNQALTVFDRIFKGIPPQNVQWQNKDQD